MAKLKRKENIPMWAQAGHKKPSTRREFLAFTASAFTASLAIPGALGLLGTPWMAHAAPNCATSSGGLAPFIHLNLSGGGSLASNFVPRDSAGALLPSYTKMGLGNNSGANALQMATEFGAPVWSQFNGNLVGQLLVGIRQQATAPTLANASAIAVCCQSRDDSAENRFDVSGLVFKAGLVGSKLPNMGTVGTRTGIRQQSAALNPPSPLVVGNFQDIANSIGYTRTLASSLSTSQKGKLARLISNLSSSQTEKLNQINGVKGVKDLVDCAGLRNIDLVAQGATTIDPIQNAQVSGLWGINNGTNNGDQSKIFAALAYNGILGNAGTVSLEMGGFDYHDNSRTTGDNRDRSAGVVIGRILETARILQRKVFLYVTSDGSTVSPENAAPGAAWTSDRGSAGIAIIFIYDPSGRPATSGFQVGHFNEGQSADTDTVSGRSPDNAAKAVFANYLKFSRQIQLFDSLVPRFDGLDSILKVS